MTVDGPWIVATVCPQCGQRMQAEAPVPDREQARPLVDDLLRRHKYTCPKERPNVY